MAWRCNYCGYMANADDAARCAICGRRAGAGRSSVAAPARPRQTPERPVRVRAEVVGRQGEDRMPVDRGACGGPPAIPVRPAQHGDGNIFGRITHLERHDERPPVDIWGIFGRILLFGLVLAPYLVLFVASGILSFVFAFLGFPSLSQLFNPIIWTTSLFELLEILVLRRIRGTDTVPVYRGVLEDGQGQEYAFSFRGPLARGNLITGHAVSLSGMWRAGTLEVQDGRDNTTGAAIASRYVTPWRAITLFLVGVYVVLTLMGFAYWEEFARRMMFH